MTTILAIDSATGPCSVAVWKDGRIAAYSENLKPAAQSAVLMPMIEETLAKTGIHYADLSAVAATIGPGSFTGIRVGLAAARGITFAAGIKGLGFTTLEVMAFAARAHKRIAAIINAGKGEYYYQAYETSPDWQPLCEARLGTLDEAKALAEGATIIGNIDPENITFPSAASLAELAAMKESGAQPLTPFYIRLPDAKLPVKKL